MGSNGAAQPLRVTVLRGGPSSEREVSLVSGQAVADACRRLGHEVAERDILPTDLSALDLPADVVFPVLHGPFGEDGQVQRLLEARDQVYVGCDSAASALAIDKAECKRRWRAAGLATAPFEVVDGATLESAFTRWVPPVVVKPIDQGSSVGVTPAKTGLQFIQALREGVARWGRMMVEQMLTGPEITVGILNGQALPIIQIVPQAEWYDYHAKYVSNNTEYRFEVDLDEDTYRRVQRDTVRAFEVLGGRDFSRVDWIVDGATGPQLLEINTIPGFTSHSLLPKAAQKAGLSFDQLVAKLLELALRRQK